MTEIYSSALQGFTEYPWRQFHREIFGGVDKYYAPFMRIEHGGFRNKDIRDILPENNEGVNVVPQIIATHADDSRIMVEKIMEYGYREIDLNFGCPYVPVCKKGMGAGMLADAEKTKTLLDALMQYRDEVTFSIKTRLGYLSCEDIKTILPLFNEFNPLQLTVHSRIGKQQYNGDLDMESFDFVYQNAEMPVVYNGDIFTVEDIKAIEEKYPKLKAVSIGRGLLANPALGREYHGDGALEVKDYLKLQKKLMNHYSEMLCGDAHIIAKLKPFWEYAPEGIDRKSLKAIKKSTTFAKYRDAVGNI